MSYLLPITQAPLHGKAKHTSEGVLKYPILRRGLRREAARLGKILQSGKLIPSPYAYGKNPHLDLVCNDLLSELQSFIPNIAQLYVNKLEHYIVELHELLLSGDRKRFPNGFWTGWQGQVNLCILTDNLFNNKLGITMEEKNKTIDPRILISDHEALLASLGHTQWESIFEEYKLIGGVYQAFDYSAGKAIMTAFHWAFDLTTPENQHAHFWDFVLSSSRVAPDAEDIKRKAVLHVLQKHLGLQLDPKNKTFDSQLLPQNQKTFLESHGCSDWTELARKYGFAKFMRWGQGKQQSQKIHQLIKDIIPWVFDLSTPEGKHLHYPDFTEVNMFAGEDGRKMALEYIKHLLEAHHGLKMDEATRYIDPRLFTRSGQRKFLKSQGFKTGTWQEFVRAHGLDKMLPQIGDFRVRLKNNEYAGSLIKALRAIYPWAFDLSQPEGTHLHFWTFPSLFKWEDVNDRRAALEHELAAAGISFNGAPQKCTNAWFKSVNLNGLVLYFDGSPFRTLKTLFPEKFADGTLTEADFRFQYSTSRMAPYAFRKITTMSWGKSVRGKIEIDRVTYLFPEEYAACFVRKESSEHAAIYKVIKTIQGDTVGQAVRKPDKVFHLVQGKKYHAPELIDFDNEKYPVLPYHIRNALIDYGIAPQSLSILQQRLIVEFFRRKGIGHLSQYLRQCGYLPSR